MRMIGLLRNTRQVAAALMLLAVVLGFVASTPQPHMSQASQSSLYSYVHSAAQSKALAGHHHGSNLHDHASDTAQTLASTRLAVLPEATGWQLTSDVVDPSQKLSVPEQPPRLVG
ncbi:MAG: hypothetical protein ABS35_25290 [Kaistia sp. SCN 65-12]|jgi:hypothetical protein|nr:MAG: hypothetical protein ABS35_25290 [Kaistia sp. SCN 65-12]